MADTLIFVHPEECVVEELAAHYGALGWRVATCDPCAEEALDRAISADPVAAVFCLFGAGAHDVEQFAARLVNDVRFKRPMLVFVGGSADEVSAARDHAPYGVFVNDDELPWVLKRLVVKS